MTKRLIALTVALTLVAVGVWICMLTPLFAIEVFTITYSGGFTYRSKVATLYSNRLVVVSNGKMITSRNIVASGLFRSRKKLKRDIYAEVINLVYDFSSSENNTSYDDALQSIDGYVYSLRIDGKTYYTPFIIDTKEGGDTDIDRIILFLKRNVESFSLE